MARTANPYTADAGQYNNVSQGINNLATAFLGSQPDPAKAAQAEAYAWRGRESRENVMDTQQARQGRQTLGSLLADFDPSGDNRQMFAQGVGSGGMEVNDLGDLYRTMQANFGGSDEQVGRAVVGAGDTLGEDDFVSLQDREMGRQRNSDNAIREDRAVMSLNQRLGDAFGSGQMSLEDIYSAQHPNRYADAAETNAKMNGGGSGSGGGAFGLDPDQGRFLDAQGTMREELGPLLQSYGVPTDDDGNLRTDLLPSGYFEGVMQQATQAARNDSFGRDISFYLENALRNQDQVPSGYTEDDVPVWGLGQERLNMDRPEQGPDPRFMELFGNPEAQSRPNPAQGGTPAPAPQQGPVRISSDADYEALAPGTEFIDPDGVRRRKP